MTEQISGAAVLIEVESAFLAGVATISAAEALVELDVASVQHISSTMILAELDIESVAYLTGTYLLIEVAPYERIVAITVNEPPVDSAHTAIDGIEQDVQTVTIYRPSYKLER